ncbi:hypothetical protein KC19_3G012600 [Ceratodon purpureus]|uniref:Uncharacterized protein n=1 Tax=Ceratodon purpureus TaxID=3225 RepID=A0A8T0IDL5_CERPU|nr:hypothetical protein KC19_3G012600 [Ceratodon purpureus]
MAIANLPYKQPTPKKIQETFNQLLDSLPFMKLCFSPKWACLKNLYQHNHPNPHSLLQFHLLHKHPTTRTPRRNPATPPCPRNRIPYNKQKPKKPKKTKKLKN